MAGIANGEAEGDDERVGIDLAEAKRGATVDVRRAAGASGTVGYPEGGGRRDDEPVHKELHGSGDDYNDPSNRVRGEPHVERALSAVLRGEGTHVERAHSEDVLAVDVRFDAHVKVKRDAELRDEVLVEIDEELDGHIEPALGEEVRGEYGVEVHVEPALGGEVRGEYGGEIRGEHDVVLDHDPVEVLWAPDLVLGAFVVVGEEGAPVPAAVRAAMAQALALKNMEGVRAAKEAEKLWDRGNLNGSNNGFNSTYPSSSEKRRFTGPKEKIIQRFYVEACYLTGNEDTDKQYRRLVDLFDQMISLMEAAEKGLSLEDSKDLTREMKVTIDEIRKVRRTIREMGGNAPKIPPAFLYRDF
uniref:Uncharacterized protein n=1 Tax=Oryza punctata TaxID=4537 RepID=A0A0E0MH59_ORYPU